MNKTEFLTALRDSLRGLPPEDIARSVEFYSEIIDDRTEDGMTQEEAVESLGSIEDIVLQIAAETPLLTLAKKRIKPRRAWRAWEIVLLAVGAPLWLPLLIAAACVALAIYVVLWVIVIAFYAADAAIAASGIGGVFGAAVFAATGNSDSALFCFGAGLVCAGLAILLFFVCDVIAKGVLRLTRSVAVGIKCRIIRKGEKV